MKLATCNHCLSIIEVEAGYNPMIHRRWCSKECFEKDAYFEEEYSDENIGVRNYKEFGINTHTGERKCGKSTPPGG